MQSVYNQLHIFRIHLQVHTSLIDMQQVVAILFFLFMCSELSNSISVLTVFVIFSAASEEGMDPGGMNAGEHEGDYQRMCECEDIFSL